DNIGYGFWTQQFQGALTTYPWKDRKTAVTTVTTWEIHGNKQDFDLTPGQDLSFTCGVSQYFVPDDRHAFLLEVGPAGNSTWQVTDDRGQDAHNPDVHDQIHSIGGQLGVTYMPWKSAVYFRYMQEYGAHDRFQGNVVALNFAVAF